MASQTLWAAALVNEFIVQGRQHLRPAPLRWTVVKLEKRRGDPAESLAAKSAREGMVNWRLLPSIPPAWSWASSPARPSDDLPLPEAPTIASTRTSRRLAMRARRSPRSHPVSASRPKNSQATTLRLSSGYAREHHNLLVPLSSILPKHSRRQLP